MSDLPSDLQSELERLLSILSKDTGEATPHMVVVRGALRASVAGSVLSVPSTYVAHWQRFHVLPTALVRDVAYSTKKASLQRVAGLRSDAVEADALAYAEAVLRTMNEGEESGG
ncbi:MAG TPA: hypothetical protein VI818_02245 [Candidatus Thermoplasmatota archaeon]|nr:hypothetical protein [Candidatus Thermoplasmatota archaeon]